MRASTLPPLLPEPAPVRRKETELPSPEGELAPPEAERRATWFELFCDLVFVAAVGQITHRISSGPTLGSVAAAAALFVPLWWTWVLYAVRANRADRDVTSHRLVTMAGLAAVCGLGVFVGSVGTSQGADTGFALSYLGARLGVAALYALEARRERVLVPLLASFGAGSAVSALFWAGGALLAPAGPVRYGSWAVGMAVDLAIPLLSGRRIARAPHHTEHLRERFGLFTIIVLGESVLGFTNGLAAAVRSAFTGVRDPVVLLRVGTALLIAALVPVAGSLPVAVVLAVPAGLLGVSVAAEGPSHRRRLAEAG